MTLDGMVRRRATTARQVAARAEGLGVGHRGPIPGFAFRLAVDGDEHELETAREAMAFLEGYALGRAARAKTESESQVGEETR